MAEITMKEFDERLNSLECPDSIRQIVGLLRTAAKQAGPVSWRPHATPNGGWGITGKRDGRVFCQFDPKPAALHVCADVVGASDHELMAAGTVHTRKNARSWVDIRDARGVKALEPLIARAYAEAGQA
jgi:hypothetical protein